MIKVRGAGGGGKNATERGEPDPCVVTGEVDGSTYDACWRPRCFNGVERETGTTAGVCEEVSEQRLGEIETLRSQRRGKHLN